MMTPTRRPPTSPSMSTSAPTDLAAALRADVAGRAHADAQGAPAQVVLRRPRLRAVRRHHPPARVLPDRDRARRSCDATPPTSPRRSGADTLVELGSGTSDKTRVLLDAFRGAGQLEEFIPFEVNEATVRAAADAIAAEYPGIAVHAVVGDFERHLGVDPPGGPAHGRLPRLDHRQLRARPGASSSAPTWPTAMRPGDSLLLGTDLVKDVGRLEAAYDDAAGVTAEFNRNVLRGGQPRARRRLRPRRLRARGLLRHRRGVDRDAAAWLSATDQVRVDALDLEWPSPPARRCAPRSRPSSAATGVQAELAGGRPPPRPLAHRPRRRLRPQPLLHGLSTFLGTVGRVMATSGRPRSPPRVGWFVPLVRLHAPVPGRSPLGARAARAPCSAGGLPPRPSSRPGGSRRWLHRWAEPGPAAVDAVDAVVETGRRRPSPTSRRRRRDGPRDRSG